MTAIVHGSLLEAHAEATKEARKNLVDSFSKVHNDPGKAEQVVEDIGKRTLQRLREENPQLFAALKP